MEQLINPQQLYRLLAGCQGYSALKTLLGPEKTDLFSEILFESELAKRSPGGRYIVIHPDEVAGLTRDLAAAVQAERSQIVGKRAYITDLLQFAQGGALRQTLEFPEGHASRRGRFRIRPNEFDAELAKAAAWVGDSLHGQPGTAVAAMLAEAVASGPPNSPLGPDPSLLDRIHRQIAPDAPRFRAPNPIMAYPSSVGGRLLLETIFEWTASAEWPPAGDENWYDVAMFYLGAIGTVQAYPDGNKRVARSAYAVVLLRARCLFVPPDREVLRDMFRMAPEE